MSIDPSGAALARDDAAVAKPFPRSPAIPPRDLAELASAIDRLEALIAAAARSESAGADAIERIADIAFVLHERDVEASLCDSLDAAVRDLGNVGTRARQSVDRMRQAAELLSELSRRINSIIARSLVAPAAAGESTAALRMIEPEPAGGQAGEEPAVEAVEAAEKMLDRGVDERAPAIATLPRASLLLNGQGATASHSPHVPAAVVGIEQSENRNVARDDIDSTHDVHSSGAADRQTEQPLADPEDDPGDLFEPRTTPMPTPDDMPDPANMSASVSVSVAALPPLPPTPPPSAPTRAEHGNTPVGENAPESHQVARTSTAPGTPKHANGRQAPNDPLAAVRALSEEEMIALFS